ncbi:MAG: hypothetical protein ABI597_12080 [Gammaproteobacteria bacterium]
MQIDINKISPAKLAEKINIPILLIHSRSDNFIPFYHAELLEKSLQHNPNVKTIFTHNKRHGELIENHQSIIKKFFDDNLKKST